MHTVMRLLVLCLMTAAAGCNSGRRTMRVQGDVTFEASPVEEGTIVFTPVDGLHNPSTGGVIRGGRYDIAAKNGPMAGETYKVEITAMKKTDKTKRNIDPGGPPVPVVYNYIPAAFNLKTTLKVTISPNASDNQHHFRLEKSGRLAERR